MVDSHGPITMFFNPWCSMDFHDIPMDLSFSLTYVAMVFLNLRFVSGAGR